MFQEAGPNKRYENRQDNINFSSNSEDSKGDIRVTNITTGSYIELSDDRIKKD